MAARSPKYPVVNLKEALERTRSVYDNEHTNRMTPEVVAQLAGYKGISGTSLRLIAALRQYGILDGRGDEVRLSEDAITVFADEEIGGVERVDALVRLSRNPPLFQEIASTFDRLPGIANIRAHLVKRKFTPKAAAKVSEIYRDTMKFVEEEINDHYDGRDPTDYLPDKEDLQHLEKKGKTTDIPQEQGYFAGLPNASVAVTQGSNLTEIERIRVSRRCLIHLYADGPYTKRDIQTLSDKLADSLKSGVYDDPEEEDLEAESFIE